MNNNNNNNSIVSIEPSNENNNFGEEIEEDESQLKKLADQENNKLVFEIDDTDSTDEEEESDEEAEELRVMGSESREVVLSDNAMKSTNNKNKFVVEKLKDTLTTTNNNEIIGVDEEEFSLDDDEGNQDVNYSNLLKKDSIEINTEVYVNEEQRIFEDDFTYVIELQRELLKTLPVTKQGLLYVQKRIEREVKKIIEVKNLAVENNIKRDRGIEYDYFNKSWIIPIVLDRHKIYAKIKEDDLGDEGENVELNNNESDANLFFTDSQEEEIGIEKVNQINQLKILKNIHHLSMLKDKISFVEYVNEFNNITKPYIWKKELSSGIDIEKNEVGYFVHYQNNQFALRYHDLEDIYWNTYNILGDMYKYKNIYNEYGRLSQIKKDILIPSERMNIVGYMVLPFGGKNTIQPDSFAMSNYINDPLLPKYFKKVGDIEKINMSKDGQYIYIHISGHGLQQGGINRLFIQNTNCFPNIDNTYHKSIEIIDNNIIGINVNKKKKIRDPSKEKQLLKIIKEGNSGFVYAVNKLEFDLYKIKKNADGSDNMYEKEFIHSNYPIKSNDINIVKEGGKIKELTGVNDTSGENPSHIKLYLFDDLKIPSEGKNHIDKIMKLVAPSLNDLIKQEYANFEKCETMEEMSKVLKPYGIELSSLKDEQTKILTDILSTQLKKLEKDITVDSGNRVKFVFHEKNKQILANPNLFLADIYINSPFIQKYYGKYINYNKPEDNIMGRITWINRHLDQGGLYYLYVLYENLDKYNDLYNLKDIVNKHKIITDNMEELDKTLKKEIQLNRKNKCKLYTYDALEIEKGSKINEYLDGESMKVERDGNIIYYLPNGSVFFFEDTFYKVEDGKKVEISEAPKGTMALVKDKIYIFNEKDGWELSEIVPKYHEIKYLCEFGDVDIKEIDLDSLDCIYREQKGCDSRLVSRLKDRIEFLDECNINCEKLEEYVKSESYRKFIENNIERILYKYFSKDIDSLEKEIEESKSEYKKENEGVTEKKGKKKGELAHNLEEGKTNNNVVKNIELKEMNTSDILTNFIHSINSLSNNDLQTNIIYELIEKDGILIGKDVYSKKFKCKMVCGHYHYGGRIIKSTNIDKRDLLYKELVTIFGDGGESNKKDYVCTNCGQAILQLDFDEVEGYTSSGAFILSRSVMEKDEMEETKTADEKIYFIDCEDRSFQELLYREGFDIGGSGVYVNYCDFIINNLCQKTGVKITIVDLIKIIKDCAQKINILIPKERYRERLLQKYRERTKLSSYHLEQMTMKDSSGKDDLDRSYDNYRQINANCIMAARFLICMQTAIPIYERSSGGAIGGFKSFDGEDGLLYMINVLENLGGNGISFDGREHAGEDESFSHYLRLNYDAFRKTRGVMDLYQQKIEYIRELKKKKTIFIDGNEPYLYKTPIYKNVPTLPDNFKVQLLSSKNGNDFKAKSNQLVDRMLFVGQEIKRIIQEVIQKYKYDDSSFILPEGSCCGEELERYVDYFMYIQIHYQDREKAESIFQYMDEARELYNMYQKYILTSGSFSIFRLKNAEYFQQNMNPIILGNLENTSQEIIQEMFENYVDEGEYKGTPREYVGIGKDAKDVKSGKTREQILNKTYSRDEYKKLLKDIEKKTTILPEKEEMKMEKIQRHKLLMMELKDQADKNLDRSISEFVNTIANVLNKKGDETLKNYYNNFIKNMGYFSNIRIFDTNEKETIVEENHRSKVIDIVDDSVKNKEKADKGFNFYEVNKRRMNIKNQLYKDEFRAQYLRRVFNTYFRFYLSFIQNNMNLQDMIDRVNDKIVGSEVHGQDIRNDIGKNFEFIKKYMTPDTNQYFKDLVFEYDSEQINAIVGTNDIYTNNFTQIIYSDFNMKNASNVVLYLLVKELYRMILCKSHDSGTVVSASSRKCQVICEFIMDIFKIIQNDTKMYNDCSNEIERFKEVMLINIINDKIRKEESVERGDDNRLQNLLNINSTKSGMGVIVRSVDDISENIDIEQDNVDESMKDTEKKDNIANFAQEQYKNKFGKTPNQDELDEFISEMNFDEKQDSEEVIGMVKDEDYEGYEEHLGDAGVGDYVESD